MYFYTRFNSRIPGKSYVFMGREQDERDQGHLRGKQSVG